MTSTEKKSVQPSRPIVDLIHERWSPRSFDDKQISDNDLMRLFEAARWAPSASNEQPWQYFFAHRGSAEFNQLWECLKPGNQPWAEKAATLVVCVARTQYIKYGTYNEWAEHDLGMANQNLILQARAMDIYGHFMGGFEKDKTTALLNLSDDQKPICVVALGYLGDEEQLSEPFYTRELTPRSRRPIDEFVTKI